MCAIWQDAEVSQFDNALLEKLPRSLRNIKLSGGEPFLRDDLPEVVARIRAACGKSRIVILTNGILTGVITEQMARIVKIDPGIAIRVSIDGAEEAHDRIRGVKGAYASARATLGSLKKLGVRDIGVTITVSDTNISGIGEVYRVSKEEGVKFNCQVAHSSDFNYRRKNSGIARQDLFRQELDRVITAELKSFSLQRLFKAYYYQGLWGYAQHLPRPSPCRAGSLFFYLSRAGNIYPCQFLDKEMGNLRNNSFSAIWKSELSRKARQDVKKCNLNCWMICTVRPGMINNPWPGLSWILPHKLKAHLYPPDKPFPKRDPPQVKQETGRPIKE
jgi:MoaA/NifB/PqqE/SkfB family radical SAM enzyme